MVDDYAVLKTEIAGQPLTDLLDARQIYALFIQPQAQPLVASLPAGPELLAHPEAFGWTKSETKNASGTWTLPGPPVTAFVTCSPHDFRWISFGDGEWILFRAAPS